MKRKYFYVISLLLFLIFGCSKLIPMPESIMTTNDVSKIKYRIIKSNLTGASYGFNLLGIIPLAVPHYNTAMAEIYSKAGNLQGKSVLFANATLEKSSIWYILFTVRKLTIRTDIVELLNDSQQKE